MSGRAAGHRAIARREWLWPLLLLILWEIAGRYDLVAQGALPAPGEILTQFWRDRADYPPHLAVTARTATLGFIIGNVAAILAAAAFAIAPRLERLARGITITLFAIPPIALVPILVIALKGEAPRIALAAITVFFPTMVSTLLGLRTIDPRLSDVVHTYGGGALKLLLKVRLPSALPGMMAGLQVAAPGAVLGAILAEFGSGSRWGLGAYLLGSLGQANPARLWGIGLSATLMAGGAYALFALLGRRLNVDTAAITLASNSAPDLIGTPGNESLAGRLFWIAAAWGVGLAAWWLIIAWLNLSPIIAYGPQDVLRYLSTGARAAQNWQRLLPAFGQTVPLAILGLFCGLAFALALALICRLRPALGTMILPAALVTQTMPLVALTPLIVLLLGRTLAATLAITISVSFFPAFVVLTQGLAAVPASAREVVAVYGAGRLKTLLLIDLPASLPHLLAAARLGAPRALLGVMIAEWLATGYGLGNLLNHSRGTLDYGMIWSVAALSVLVAIALYQLFSLVERLVVSRSS
jgi:ABC-type nitrate/sulfonate/bicarbonate transport system permease component